jgi:hypothetical protein
VTKGYIRVGTTLGFFSALLALDVPPGGRVSGRRVAASAALLTLTVLSDTYALVVGVPAVLIVCALGLLRGNPYAGVGLWGVAGAAAGSAAAARALVLLIRALGGYRVVPASVTELLADRDTPRVVLGNALNLAANLPALYRCGLIDEVTAPSLAVWVACLSGPALLLYALARGAPATLRVRRVRRPGPGPAHVDAAAEAGAGTDFMGDVLWVIVVLGPVAYVASRLVKDASTIRYMIPSVLSGAVLTGRVLPARVRDLRSLVAILAILAAAYAATVRDDCLKTPADDTAARLAAFLGRVGLRHGYGSYWDASIVTASGRGRVAVRPVWIRPISPESHAIKPMNWMTDRLWYEEGPVTFLVFEREPAARYQWGITEWHVTTTFGTPTAKYDLPPYVVLVWGHDLRPFIDIEGLGPSGMGNGL